ncbi:MAG TPA: hypothetical protein VMV50_03150 [Candidatus Paceibacterota bacterium]|nr:hypothetical protein [Candidatus Paceibacterota bacterium]
MTRTLASTLFALALFTLAPIAASAQGTDCNILVQGASCVTSSGASGTCQPTGGNYGNMTCQGGAQQSTTGTNTGGAQSTAGTNTGGPSVTLTNPLNTGSNCSATNTCLNVFLMDILQLVIRIGAVVVVVMLVYVGFLFVTAQGNESKLSRAKQALLWTIVGALILLGAEAIAQGIQATVQALSV